MKFNPVILFTVFMLVVFAFAAFKAPSFSFAGRLFPLIIGIPALILTLLQLVIDLRAHVKPEEDALQDFVDIAPDTDVPPRVIRARGIRFLLWILGLYLGIWVVGFKISVPIFFVAFMRLEGRGRWIIVLPLTAISIYSIFFYFERLLGIFWPRPLVSDWIDIPWLF